MKTLSFRRSSALLSLSLATSALFIIACEPNDPPPQSVLKAEIQYNIIPTTPPTVCPLMVCVEPGDNCAIPGINPSSLTTNQLTLFQTFYRMSEHDSASYFFANYDWEEIFNLPPNNNIVSGVVNGRFRVKVFKDSSIVILGDPEGELTTENIIYALYSNNPQPPCGVE